MKNNPSQISFNSISKYNEDYNSSITMNTINPNIANLIKQNSSMLGEEKSKEVCEVIDMA